MWYALIWRNTTPRTGLDLSKSMVLFSSDGDAEHCNSLALVSRRSSEPNIVRTCSNGERRTGCISVFVATPRLEKQVRQRVVCAFVRTLLMFSKANSHYSVALDISQDFVLIAADRSTHNPELCSICSSVLRSEPDLNKSASTDEPVHARPCISTLIYHRPLQPHPPTLTSSSVFMKAAKAGQSCRAWKLNITWFLDFSASCSMTLSTV